MPKTREREIITDEVSVAPIGFNDIPVFSQPQLSPYQRLLLLRATPRVVTCLVPGVSAATATNYGTFFIADRSYRVLDISEEHRTAGTNAGTVTISVEKCETGEAEGAGDDLLATALSLKTTAATPQFGSLSITSGVLDLKRGDRLVAKDVGTLTDVAHVCLTIILQEL